MNRRIASRVVLGLALLVAWPAALPAAGSADVPVTVRAVTFDGDILLDRKIRAGTTRVPTSRQADCLGGSPSDGRVSIPGATALGALQEAAMLRRPRRPLLLTNAFDFGLGVCGVGGRVARGEQWWELSVNHVPSSLGGEGTKLEAGDEVLWYLSETYMQPSPDELGLSAPDSVPVGRPFKVRVLAYDDRGRGRPVEGARISVPGSQLSDSRGYSRVTLGSRAGLFSMVARSSGFIPSDREYVRVRR
jgi:hypothetical protein